MKAARWLAVPLVLLIAYLIAKETREPHIWLTIDDLLHPKPQPLAAELPEGLALHLYADTRPHIGKVARLQKGLVLSVDGRERIEEGFGLGLPLVQADGQVYMSRSATVEQTGNALVKHFEMDTVDTPSGFLRRKYEPVPSIGTVTVTYTIGSGGLDVTVDLRLKVPWEKAYLMNEQGARFFTRYEEPGLAVEGDQFGKWQPTTAAQGCIVAADRSVRFCVESGGQAQLYYGRERYHQYYLLGIYRLSWAGIDLEWRPSAGPLRYRILLERLPHG